MKGGGSAKFWVLGGLAVSALFAVGILLAPKLPPLPEPDSVASTLQFFKESEVSQHDREFISLLDYSPVFLSTPWNYGHPEPELPQPFMDGLRPREGGAYDSMSAFRSIQVGEQARIFEWDWMLEGFPFGSFKSDDSPATVAEPKIYGRARMSVMPADGGPGVYAGMFDVHSVPDGRFWAPVEMLLFVNSDEAPAAPLIISGSGIEALDAELQNHAAGKLQGLNLPAGYYIVTLAP